MAPTLFRIGDFHIATYGVLVAIAVFVAGWLATRSFREHRLEQDAAWSLLVYGLVGGFIGAKLYYVVLQGDATALFSRSGLVWYGGLAGGMGAVLFAIRRKKLPLGTTADALAPSLAIGHAIGHVGCFFSGDSYGLPSTLPWAVAFRRGAPPSTAGNLRSLFGVNVPNDVPDGTVLTVHPTMLYSALALTGIFALLWMLRRSRGSPGWLFGLYLVLTGIERFSVEFLRAKDDRLLWGFTTAQAVAASAIVGGGLLLILLRRNKARSRPMLAAAG